MFSTEGHIFPIDKRFRTKPWEENDYEDETTEENSDPKDVVTVAYNTNNNSFYNVS